MLWYALFENNTKAENKSDYEFAYTGRNVRSPGIYEINELVINWYEKAAHYAAIPREFSAVKEKYKTGNNTNSSYK